jgi:hypothetical protein
VIDLLKTQVELLAAQKSEVYVATPDRSGIHKQLAKFINESIGKPEAPCIGGLLWAVLKENAEGSSVREAVFKSAFGDPCHRHTFNLFLEAGKGVTPPMFLGEGEIPETLRMLARATLSRTMRVYYTERHRGFPHIGDHFDAVMADSGTVASDLVVAALEAKHLPIPGGFGAGRKRSREGQQTCYGCGGVGHFLSRCPNRRATQAPTLPARPKRAGLRGGQAASVKVEHPKSGATAGPLKTPE